MDPDIDADHELAVFRHLESERRDKERRHRQIDVGKEDALKERVRSERVRPSFARKHSGGEEGKSFEKDSAAADDDRKPLSDEVTETDGGSPLMTALKRKTSFASERSKERPVVEKSSVSPYKRPTMATSAPHSAGIRAKEPSPVRGRPVAGGPPPSMAERFKKVAGRR